MDDREGEAGSDYGLVAFAATKARRSAINKCANYDGSRRE